jgi:hypothetical protein
MLISRMVQAMGCVIWITCALHGGETEAVVLNLGPPQKVLNFGAPSIGPDFGILYGPDMQMPIVPQADGSLNLFITGGIEGGTKQSGSTQLLKMLQATSLLLHSDYATIPAGLSVAQTVLAPTCAVCADGSLLANCHQCDPTAPDANYTGMTSVFPSADGQANHLIGIYHCETRTFKDDLNIHLPFTDGFFAQVCRTESTTGGQSWTRGVSIITGEPLPAGLIRDSNGIALQVENGTPQPIAFVDGGYIYVFYPYHATGQFKPAGSTCNPTTSANPNPPQACPSGLQGTIHCKRT